MLARPQVRGEGRNRRSISEADQLDEAEQQVRLRCRARTCNCGSDIARCGRTRAAVPQVCAWRPNTAIRALGWVLHLLPWHSTDSIRLTRSRRENPAFNYGFFRPNPLEVH